MTPDSAARSNLRASPSENSISEPTPARFARRRRVRPAPSSDVGRPAVLYDHFDRRVVYGRAVVHHPVEVTCTTHTDCDSATDAVIGHVPDEGMLGETEEAPIGHPVMELRSELRVHEGNRRQQQQDSRADAERVDRDAEDAEDERPEVEERARDHDRRQRNAVRERTARTRPLRRRHREEHRQREKRREEEEELLTTTLVSIVMYSL